MLPWPESLVFETVDHTLDELLDAFDRASEERPQLRHEGFPRYELSVDTIGNAITVHSDDSPTPRRSS